MSWPVLFTYRIDARTLSLGLCLCLCLLPKGKGTVRRRRTQALKPCLTSSRRALVMACFVGFPTAHFLIRVFEPWHHPLCAGQPSPRQAVPPVRVGLPTQDKRQWVTRGPSRRCATPNTHSSSNRPAVSHCHRNRALRLEISASQLHLHWTDQSRNRSSTRQLGNDQTPLTTETDFQVPLQPRQPSTCQQGKATSQAPSLTLN